MTKPPTRNTLGSGTTGGNRDKAFTAGTHSPTLAFELPTGNYVSYQYTHLMTIDFAPAEGIFLRFTRDKYLVKGRNLLKLYTALLKHGVAIIHVNNDIPENETAVTEIEILEGVHDFFIQN